jgi:hypothetical protein
MISGDELKYRNGLAGFLSLGIAPPYPIRRVPLAGAFALTGPVGTVWTCDTSAAPNPAPVPNVQWPKTNASDSFNDSLRQGMETGAQMRRAQEERERIDLERERLELERQRLDADRQRSRDLSGQPGASVPTPPATVSDPYLQEWLTKAQPRMGLYPDFAAVVFESDVAITPDMVKLMAGSEFAADIAYYLGTHKAEARAIAMLPLLDAARAIDAIEAQTKADADKSK